jgi:microcystin-dependent protein
MDFDDEYYLGEIRQFGGNFAPVDFMFCNGQLLSIAENDALYALLGTTYGGDGVTTFGLPDLRGRIPIGQGQGPGLANYTLGQIGGAETVTLSTAQMPGHTHSIAVGGTATTTTAANNVVAQATTNAFAATGTPTVSLAGSTLSSTGGNQPHENMPPFLATNFIICVAGIFPSQS